MTLRVIDGYDYLAAGYNQGYLEASGWTGDTYALYIDSGNTAFGYGKSLGLNSNANRDTVYRNARGRVTAKSTMGMRMFVPTGTNTLQLGTYDTNVNALQWLLKFDNFGCITYLSNVGGTVVAKTPAYTFFPGRWFYLEVQWLPGYGTSGTMEVRVNTVAVLSLPATVTAYGTVVAPATLPGYDLIEWKNDRLNDGNTSSQRWDDFYLLDNLGTVNNTWLGNARAKYMAPVSNSTPLQFTIGGSAPAATNWQSVLNQNLDDTKYVYASTVGYQDLYGIDPNLNTPAVFGVEVAGAYRQDDATQRFIKNTIKSASVTTTGPARAINQSYTFYPDIYELDPNTGVGFTGAAVNALTVGPKVDT